MQSGYTEPRKTTRTDAAHAPRRRDWPSGLWPVLASSHSARLASPPSDLATLAVRSGRAYRPRPPAYAWHCPRALFRRTASPRCCAASSAARQATSQTRRCCSDACTRLTIPDPDTDTVRSQNTLPGTDAARIAATRGVYERNQVSRALQVLVVAQ